MLGYGDTGDDISPDWYRLVHPDDMTRVQKKMRAHLEGKAPYFQSIHRMKHQNGEWRWMTSRAKALQDERGRLVRILGAENDITEQKLYEEALFREKESAQITLRSIGDGVRSTMHTGARSTIFSEASTKKHASRWKIRSPLPCDAIVRSNPCVPRC